jgi:hypothetical protein
LPSKSTTAPPLPLALANGGRLRTGRSPHRRFASCPRHQISQAPRLRLLVLRLLVLRLLVLRRRRRRQLLLLLQRRLRLQPLQPRTRRHWAGFSQRCNANAKASSCRRRRSEKRRSSERCSSGMIKEKEQPVTCFFAAPALSLSSCGRSSRKGSSAKSRSSGKSSSGGNPRLGGKARQCCGGVRRRRGRATGGRGCEPRRY